jgi:hypothetical protein
VIAAFLRRSRRKIAAEFGERTGFPSGPSATVLGEGRRLERFLHELAVSLKCGRVTHERPRWLGPKPIGKSKKALDLGGLIREIATLKDCVFDLLQASSTEPALDEMRLLFEWFDVVIAEAREAQTLARYAKLRDQNQRLLVLFDVLLDAIDPEHDGEPVDARRKADQLAVLAVDLRKLEAEPADDPPGDTGGPRDGRRRFSCLPGGKSRRSASLPRSRDPAGRP